MSITVPFGLSEAIPEDAKVAWGARFIVTQDGHVDLPYDRAGFSGDGPERDELLNRMIEALPISDLTSSIRGLLTMGILNTRVAGRVLIYADEHIRVVGDTKGSGGYLYLAAFFTEDVKEDVATKTVRYVCAMTAYATVEMEVPVDYDPAEMDEEALTQADFSLDPRLCAYDVLEREVIEVIEVG